MLFIQTWLRQRKLQHLRSYLNRSHPSLNFIEENALIGAGSFAQLVFRHHERKCIVYYCGSQPNPCQEYYWGSALLFQVFSLGREHIGRIITLWVADEAMPSVILSEFPIIQMRANALYYELGKFWEGDIALSWECVESDYHNRYGWQKKVAVLELIHQLKELGWHTKFRAGTSLSTLVLSRARHHGLKEGHHWVAIAFDFIGNAEMQIISSYGVKKAYDHIAYNEDLDNLLRRLELEPVF